MNFKSQKGFSLIEITTVVAIIVTMTAVVFANYKSGNRQFALELQAYKLAQDLRKTQEMAMAAQEIPGYDPSGYGVFLKQGDTDYKLYADVTVPSNSRYDTGSDYVIQTVNFENKVYIQTLDPDLLSVNFSPPDPLTTVSGGSDPPITQATIVLGMEGSLNTRTIVVNKAGLIYVE